MAELAGVALVTGGAGFIGSHLVDRLLSLPQIRKVIVLDDFSAGRMENLQHHLGNPRFKLVKGSITDRTLVKDLLREVDYVFHEAAIVSVELSTRKPIQVNRVNVEGSLTLLEAALRA
ncbi:MAG: hypothetical protein DRO52_02280, partial [Candidatus Hecatellales archaeon]